MTHEQTLLEAHRRILIDCLEARLIACEVWRASLNFMIDSPLTTKQERDEALRHRDAALVEWGEIMTTLAEVREGNFGCS